MKFLTWLNSVTLSISKEERNREYKVYLKEETIYVYSTRTILDVLGGNPVLRGIDDYYGNAIAMIHLQIYNVIYHDTIEYYLGVKDPSFTPNPDLLKNEMNEIIQQAVVFIENVGITQWDCSDGCPYDILINNNHFDYIYTDSGDIYNEEYNWIRDNTSIKYCSIVHVNGIREGWRVLNATNPGDSILFLDDIELDKIVYDEIMWYGKGKNIDMVAVRTIEYGPHGPYAILREESLPKVQHGINEFLLYQTPKCDAYAIPSENLCMVEDETFEKFAEWSCHEFMHLYKNGFLKDINHPREKRNLMYYMTKSYEQRILKYQTANWVKQWDDAHNGF